MIAIGIGLHNLGEGLAIGSAYAVGALALGAFLIIGFAIQNTTEGLAIVAPLSKERPTTGRLAFLGVRVGERVTWQNNESTPHNVIANTGATFRSELIQRDGTFAFTPARPGVIRYFCSLHRGMTATLRVTPK